MPERPDPTATIQTPQSEHWTAVEKPRGELERVLGAQSNLSDSATDALRTSALEILSRCGDPGLLGSHSRTGLVVGYVQSGKTLSFTSVAAAAADNGYKTVVVLGGSSVPLAEQNADRLEQDLEVLSGYKSTWIHKHNPVPQVAEELRGGLRSSLLSRVLLLTAMKHQTHTRNLSGVLAQLGELAEPILIIDDEADSISLNTKAKRDDESRNYQEICQLRRANPRHAYLQYTATPQANVLISVLGLLAPDFGQVLEPGQGYLGGKQMFVDNPGDFIRTIPAEDDRQAREDDVFPEVLTRALATYLVGVAQWWFLLRDLEKEPPSHLSMMIHPDQRTGPHEKYANWVRDFFRRVKFELPEPAEPGRVKLVEFFRDAYEDVSATYGSEAMVPFDRLLELVPEAVETVKIQEFRGNSKPSKGWKKAWRECPHWVLIGGQLLDRGFTVEGLAVTYMPRSIGGGQADTIQQRARFFGYKESYRGLCRVFITKIAQDAYRACVEHEESLRNFIRMNQNRLGDRATIRRFRLDPMLKPTRDSVLTERVRRARREAWFFQRWVGSRAATPSIFDGNRDQVNEFFSQTSGSTEGYHEFFETTVGELERLLTTLVVDGNDCDEWENWLAELRAKIVEEPHLEHEGAWVVRMRPGQDARRSLMQDQPRIKEVPVGPSGNYDGDRSIKRGELTLQVHDFALDDEPSNQSIVILGLWASNRLRTDLVIQDPTGAQV